jgi:hypothetical protein
MLGKYRELLVTRPNKCAGYALATTIVILAITQIFVAATIMNSKLLSSQSRLNLQSLSIQANLKQIEHVATILISEQLTQVDKTSYTDNDSSIHCHELAGKINFQNRILNYQLNLNDSKDNDEKSILNITLCDYLTLSSWLRHELQFLTYESGVTELLSHVWIIES